jgi:SAM-dependent methyltransferase
MARSDHWTHKLFVEHPEMYLPALEEREAEADGQADALVELFSRNGVPEGGRVLDAACGTGRHSIRLARRGYRVTGVDLSPLYIRKAQERAIDEGLDAQFLRGDLNRVESLLHDEPPFDAVINMFTSSGYYGKAADLYLFRQLWRLASPSGVLVVLTVNRDWVMRVFRDELTTEMGAHHVVIQQSFDIETSTMYNTWNFHEGEEKQLKLSVPMELRMYSLHEIRGLLEEAGWKYRRGLGSGRGDEIDLQNLTFDHTDMWIVARAN